MSYNVSGTTINLTRGDTFKARIELMNGDEPYVPSSGDRIRFAMKRRIADREPILIKQIPNDTLQLKLEPEDTKTLSYGAYVYDIELTTASGDVDTFITVAKLNLTEEVH